MLYRDASLRNALITGVMFDPVHSRVESPQWMEGDSWLAGSVTARELRKGCGEHNAVLSSQTKLDVVSSPHRVLLTKPYHTRAQLGSLNLNLFLNRPQSIGCHVCILSYILPLLRAFWWLFTPICKGRQSNKSITKDSLWKSYETRIFILAILVINCSADKSGFLGLCELSCCAQHGSQQGEGLLVPKGSSPRKSSRGRGSIVLIFLLIFFFFKIPDLVHGPTAAPVATKNRRQMALQTFYGKSDSTIQQSVLCQVSFLFLPGSPKTPV